MRRLGCSGEGPTAARMRLEKPPILEGFHFLGDGHIPAYINRYVLYLLSTVTGKGKGGRYPPSKKHRKRRFYFEVFKSHESHSLCFSSTNKSVGTLKCWRCFFCLVLFFLECFFGKTAHHLMFFMAIPAILKIIPQCWDCWIGLRRLFVNGAIFWGGPARCGGGAWRIIPFSKWLIAMVIVSPLAGVIPLPNGLNGL